MSDAQHPALSVQFGAMAPPLSIQFERQGWTVTDHAELMRVETISKAVATVKIHGLMSASQADRAYRKMVARLEKISRRAKAPDNAEPMTNEPAPAGHAAQVAGDKSREANND